MAEGSVVTAADLDLKPSGSEQIFDLRSARKRAERDAINLAIAESDGNLSRAAGLLGVSRPTLYELLDQHEIASPRAAAGAQLAKEK